MTILQAERCREHQQIRLSKIELELQGGRICGETLPENPKTFTTPDCSREAEQLGKDCHSGFDLCASTLLELVATKPLSLEPTTAGGIVRGQ
eukprot:1177749-Prorocentrum_minimum.AAC.1